MKEDTEELKLLKRYMGDIVCSVKGEPLNYIEYANSLHKNLPYTLETQNGSEDVEFLNLNINENEDKKLSCHWYQKLTDTGIILNHSKTPPKMDKILKRLKALTKRSLY